MKVNEKLWCQFLKGKKVIVTETQEEFNKLMEIIDEKTELKWGGSGDPIKSHPNYWDVYKENTTIEKLIPSLKWIYYGNKNICSDKIDFKDLFSKEEVETNGDRHYFMENCNTFIFDDDMLEPVKEERKGLLEPLDSEEVKKRKEAEEPFRRVGLLPVHDDESLPETSEKYQVLYPSDLDEEEEEEEKSDDFITLDHLHKVVELENTNVDYADWQLTYEEIKTIYNRIIQVEKEAQ